MFSFFLLVACSEFGLNTVKPEDAVLADTAGTAPDTAVATDTAGGPAADTAVLPDDDAAACPTFTFEWTAPMAGEINLMGELSAPDGTVFLAWEDWAGATGTNHAQATRELCAPAVFRGEGAIDSNGDGADDSWSCYSQGAPGEYGEVGTVSFALDGAPLAYTLTPAPTSDGCELTVDISW